MENSLHTVINHMTMTQTSLAPIALFPLIGSILTFLIGLKNKHIAPWVATAMSALSFAWVLKLFFGMPENVVYEDTLFNWISSGTLDIAFQFRFDHLTAVMCLVVTGIGTLIHLYSTAYMHEDASVHRFFSYLNLFMFSMLVLVLGANLMVLFVGWEGVGLCSYLLIGFWFKETANAKAGMKAFVVNRIGDAGFLIAAFMMLKHLGTFDFEVLKNAVAISKNLPEMVSVFSIITICLFIGATGKSAQIPLFIWLPDAMAGPTPVSALIHAATMVTAGVYMIARLNFVFVLAPETMAVVTCIAVLTAFVAATIAICQNDIKKVLAYSTVSQLGFMFMGVGSGAYWVAVFHLVTHAFFKACLFLGSGSVIHACHHEQDMRQMGGLRKVMPITFWTYAISCLAIAGVAPFAGYYSKHAILAALQNNQYVEFTYVLAGLANLTAFITAFYMTRSLVMTFFGEYRGHAHPHESPWNMTLPLVVLALLAVIGGWYGHDLEHYLSTVLPVGEKHHAESLIEAIMHSWIGILGMVLAFYAYTKGQGIVAAVAKTLKSIQSLLAHKYFIDEIYAALIVTPLHKISKFLWKGVDQSMIDATVNASAAVVDANGEILRKLQTGQIAHYALFLFIGTVLIISCYMVL